MKNSRITAEAMRLKGKAPDAVKKQMVKTAKDHAAPKRKRLLVRAEDRNP